MPPRMSLARAGTFRSLPFSITLLSLLAANACARAEVVILKDGYAIHGKVVAEQTVFADKLNGEPIVTQKMGGLTLIDDGPRLTVFSAHYKRVGDVDPQNKFAEHIKATQPVRRKTSYVLPPELDLQSATEFNANWVRLLTYRNPFQPQNPHRIEQVLDTLTPHYARMQSISHVWSTYYLTSELGAEKVVSLLRSHPEFKETGKPDGDKRAKLIRFMIQAGWLNEAETELDALLKVLPDEAKRIDEFRAAIAEARLDSTMADIERAKDAGQHQLARRLMASLPRDNLPAKHALRVAGWQAEYDASFAKLDKAQRYLKELQQLVNGAKFKEMIRGADIIASELQVDAVSRLDLFITLAEQNEAARKEGRPPIYEPEKLLAAAVCGWLLGNNSTETDVVSARKRLRARDMALAYLHEALPPKRHGDLQGYMNDSAEALPFDELEKLISLLPPPDAEANLPASAVEKRTGPLPGILEGARYVLQLPPEYSHTRPYPLLVVLPDGGERPSEILKRLGDLPARYGYIVAVIDWCAGLKGNYNYTDEEQLLVTGTLRHLRRTLQVDSDKIFVFGNGEGANFAFDLGATHPDLFAGIVPMTPSPDYQFFRVFQYWKNFQVLPVYMVVGDRAGDSVKTIRSILSEWMPRGYPALAVSYKGRGFEWFGEELPYIFDWMSRKTRAAAFPDLGSNNYEFRTVRASSNHFYWISTDEIEPASLFDPERRNRILFPATIQAHLHEGNRITVESMRLRQLSIWLGRNTVDFSKPVYVELKGIPHGTWKRELTPKISVLLEDLYERGDRQRPFYQRIDCKDLNKVVKFSAQ